MTVVTIAALGVLALPALALAGESLKVGVMSAGRTNVSSSRALDLTDQIAAALRSHLRVDTVSGRRAAMAADSSEEVSPECLVDSQCLVVLLRNLDVDVLLLASVTKVGSELRIDLIRYRARYDRPRNLEPIQTSSEATRAAFSAAAARLVPTAVRRQRDRESPQRQLVTLGLAATSIATLAGAAGFGIATWVEHDELGERCGNRVCGEGDLDTLETRRLTADILLGVGIATGAAAAVLWLTGGDASEGEGAVPSTALTAGPGDIGASVVTRF